MDEKKMEAAINRCLDKVEANAAREDAALKFSQAVLNLAHAKEKLKSIEK